MARLHLFIWAILFAGAGSVAGACARQTEGLTPISPAEEQGKRRTVMIGFRPGAARGTQEIDNLPAPRQPASQEPTAEPEDITPPDRQRSGGEVGEEIRQRYPDGSPQIVRHVRQDAEGNYVNHGPWKLYNRRGQVLAEGDFVNGRMQGTWTRWHPDGDPAIQALWQNAARSGPYQSIATLVEGRLEGSWIVYDRFRKKIFEMQYVDGRRHGPAMWWDEAGRLVREVRFQQGVIDGRLIEYDEQNQPRRETTYIAGQRVYSEVTWFSEGKKKTEDFYLDGKLELAGEDDWWEAQPAEYTTMGSPTRHGPTRAWYENGQPRMSGQFEQGKRHGAFTWWHSNGQRQLVGVYDHGVRTANWTWWHANGMKSVQGTYQSDEPMGEWVYWDTEGKVVRRSTLGRTAGGLDSLLEEPDATDPSAPAPTAQPPSSALPNFDPPLEFDTGEIEEITPPSDGGG